LPSHICTRLAQSKTELSEFCRKNCGHLPVCCYETNPEEKVRGGIAPPRASVNKMFQGRVVWHYQGLSRRIEFELLFYAIKYFFKNQKKLTGNVILSG